jgi:AcrR family transcriptional regulator
VQERLQIPGKSDDARARRARDQIAWALIELMRERPYDTITVQEIAERAQVSRTTFYAHFQDRDDIMVRYNVVFGQFLGEQLRWDGAGSQYRFPIEHLFAHVRSFRFLYESLTRARRLEDLIKVLRINMADEFEKRILATRDEASGVPASLLAQHLAGTIVQLLVWWMEHHRPCEPQTMDDHFHRLIAGLA